MDPHMTREDSEILEFGPHRRLRQRLSPPKAIPAKKKKLVNFRISRKGLVKSDDYDDNSSIKYEPVRADGRATRGNSRHLDDRAYNIGSFGESREDSRFFDDMEAIIKLEERREDIANFNERRDDIRNFNVGRDGRNFNEREDWLNFNERREDIGNFNERREGVRNDNERRENFRNPKEKTEDLKNLKERKEDLRYIKGGREDRRSVKEKREDYRNMKERKGGTRSERREDVTNANERRKDYDDIEVDNNVSSDTRDNKNYVSSNEKSAKCPPTQRGKPSKSNTGSHPRGHRVLSTDTTPWDKLRLAAGSNGNGNRLDNVVEIMTTIKKRTGCPAPTIWTPAVPRSAPTPRPANFQNQEEPGKGTYVVSFISRAVTQARLRMQRRQLSLPYKQSQSHHEWETRGKMYVKWLKGVITNPNFQEGVIMKGLEIAVPYPVLHLREKLPGTMTGGDGERRMLEGNLGTECVLHQGVYQEVVTWVPELLVTCPSDPSQWARCYIVIGFKTLDGELNERMEKLWKEWTGALYIYCSIDDDLGLKKLTFYKRSSPHQATLFSYILIVEVETVTQENSLHLLDFTYRMRMKHMTGYISVYQEHYPDGAVDVVPGGSPVPSTAQAAAAAAAAGVHVEPNVLDFTRINI